MDRYEGYDYRIDGGGCGAGGSRWHPRHPRLTYQTVRVPTVQHFTTGQEEPSVIKDSLSRTFNSRIRQSILKTDWCRIVEQLTAEELLKFSGNPLFVVNAIAEEFGCELSSVGWDKFVGVRFVKRYGRNKVILKVLVNRDLFADPPQLEALLRATLPKRVAVANDKNTIREYFGPAASH